MYEIKAFNPGDFAAVRELWGGCEGVGLNDHDDSEAGICRYLARNPGTSFVADEAGRIVGAVLAGHDGRRGFIYHLAVRGELRGRGIGRALVEAALAALRAEGIAKAALVVFSSNAAGNGFWERMGFDRRNDLVYRNRSIAE